MFGCEGATELVSADFNASDELKVVIDLESLSVFGERKDNTH